jgi:hypothetical protein
MSMKRDNNYINKIHISIHNRHKNPKFLLATGNENDPYLQVKTIIDEDSILYPMLDDLFLEIEREIVKKEIN